MKAGFLQRLAAHLEQHGLVRVHADAVEQTAQAAVAALAGLPSYEQLWVGELGSSVQIVAVASGERLPGVELARRAQLLRERAAAMERRVRGRVQVLQIAVYERPVPAQERDFILAKARIGPLWPFGSTPVSTWVVALAEPALHARRTRGWPQELGASQVGALFSS